MICIVLSHVAIRFLAGDNVFTDEGKIQIKLSEGGYAWIQPRTQYSLAKYVYRGDADGSERGLFRLLKGAVRFVAGAIGKKNRRNFRISTNTATIGIRGSGGLVEQYESGGVRCTKIHTHERSSDLLPMVLGLEQHYREGDQHHYIESNPTLRLLHTSLTDGPKRQ